MRQGLSCTEGMDRTSWNVWQAGERVATIRKRGTIYHLALLSPRKARQMGSKAACMNWLRRRLCKPKAATEGQPSPRLFKAKIYPARGGYASLPDEERVVLFEPFANDPETPPQHVKGWFMDDGSPAYTFYDQCSYARARAPKTEELDMVEGVGDAVGGANWQFLSGNINWRDR